MSELDSNAIRLTQTVKKGGCAAKLPAGELRRVLGGLPLQNPPALRVGIETLDDACLWDLGDGRFMIQTLDFFTPIVDDPEEFGAIAAANALSDVYAMGGSPQVALSILAFPTAVLPLELLDPLMRGALSKILEAGACLAGGHTIDDETLKFGLSVTGFVEKSKAWTNAGAKPGDVLLLTKGLGTGTITSALKSGEADPQWVVHAVASMKQLNTAPELLDGLTVNAATDVTGFGFLGHALQMARGSGVSFEIAVGSIPAIEGAWESLRREHTNRAHVTNRQYVLSHVDWGTSTELEQLLLLDAQTSGGLLLAVPPHLAQEVEERLKSRFPLTSRVGRVLPPSSHFVRLSPREGSL